MNSAERKLLEAINRKWRQAIEQRDELLAALIRLRDCPDVQMDCTEPETDAARLEASAAIAKCSKEEA